MNSKTRQRAMRSFLAALLQSDLTKSEMDEIADGFAYGSLGTDLAQFIREAMEQVVGPNRFEPELALPTSAETMIHETILRRKMPKKSVLQLMTLASPWMKPKDIPANLSTREAVERYVRLASPPEVSKLYSILQGEPADAYMKGIARRDRAK